MRVRRIVLVIATGVLLSCGRGPADPAAAPDSVAALVDQLRAGSTADQAAVTRRLVGLGVHAVPELIRAAAESKDTSQRVRAVLTLGSIGPEAEAALPVLRQIVDEGVPHLSESAQEASERIRGPTPESTHTTWEEWWKANRAAFYPDTPAMR